MTLHVTRRRFIVGSGAAALTALAKPALALTPAQRAVILGRPPFNPLSLFANYAVHSLRRVIPTYPATSPLVRLRRSSDNAESDFSGAGGWVSKAAISAWLAGATGYVVTVYDQTGNSRHAEQSTAGNQPTIDLSGTNPTIKFARASSQFFTVSSAGAFSQNQPAVSLIAVRKYATNDATTQNIVAVSTNAAATREALLLLGNKFAAGGRTLDADSFQSTTGFSPDTNWGVEVGRFYSAGAKLYHQVEYQTEVRDPFQSASNISNTASATIWIGQQNSASFFDGQLTLVALVRQLLTDAQTNAVVAALASLKN